MDKNITLRQWIENFKNFQYHVDGVDVAISCGWYDWFCKDSALLSKTKKLGPKVIQIAESKKIDKDETYVFFKNNCPCNGRLYDDFRICSIEDGEVIYTVTPRVGYSNMNGEAEVWGRENGFEKALVSGTWKDVRKFFGV